jgi:beta-lactamase regulating signal transducer with metallopeptidase domain
MFYKIKKLNILFIKSSGGTGPMKLGNLDFKSVVLIPADFVWQMNFLEFNFLFICKEFFLFQLKKNSLNKFIIIWRIL